MCVSPRYHESIGMWDRRQKHIAQMGLHQTYPLSPALGTRDPTAHGQKSQVPLQLRGKSAPGILLGFPAMMTELSIPWLDPHWTIYLSVQWSHPYAYVCLHTQTHVNHWQKSYLKVLIDLIAVWRLHFRDEVMLWSDLNLWIWESQLNPRHKGRLTSHDGHG